MDQPTWHFPSRFLILVDLKEGISYYLSIFEICLFRIVSLERDLQVTKSQG
jgi:hypothetical protein